MVSIYSLVDALSVDYPSIQFQEGERDKWDPSSSTVYFKADTSTPANLLHELSHALLGHIDYDLDIELVRCERDAWHYAASTLSAKYAVNFDEELVEQSLDTYRIWLHERSLCPTCCSSGVQQIGGDYACPLCLTYWRANDARITKLRRYRLQPSHAFN